MKSDSLSFENYRGYLTVMAEAQLDERLQAKVSAEDIVQQVLVKAEAGAAELRDLNTGTVMAWLRSILTHELADTIKYFYRSRRNVAREVNVGNDVDQSAAGLEAWLNADITSPSQAASRNEEMLRLTKALLTLPEDVRQVVVMKHLKNMQLREISEATNRSVASVAGLLRRGLAKLRQILESNN
ncbi:MAG: sigma-70 family RNA polymerase sigma factor [Planctomycetaceae bacterium]